jgi:NCS1 family nucleobase:cation symporter-1
VIAYWIAPWLAVVLTDQVMRRGTDPELLLFDTKHRNLAGPVSMAVGMGVSIWLFSNQTDYVGLVPAIFPRRWRHHLRRRIRAHSRAVRHFAQRTQDAGTG